MTTASSNQLINSLTSKKLPDNYQTQSTHSTTGDYEKKATIYLFTKLESVYGAKWRQTFATPEALKNARHTWASYIGKFTREDIDMAIKNIIDLRIANDPNFEWPDLSKVISLMSGDYESEFAKWEHKSAAYKKFDESTALEILPASEEKAKQVFKELWSKL